LDVLVGVDADDGVAEVDSSRRRMNDTYVGIVVGVLAVVILFIVVVSIVVGTRLRRRKYSGSGGSPSKFVFSGGDLRHSSVDYSQTLPLGAVRFIIIVDTRCALIYNDSYHIVDVFVFNAARNSFLDNYCVNAHTQ